MILKSPKNVLKTDLKQLQNSIKRGSKKPLNSLKTVPKTALEQPQKQFKVSRQT
jgi:hypothetical protein